MKSVLLTRSIEDNQEIIRALERHNVQHYNFNYIFCPLIEYKDLKINYSFLNNYSNIIVTSKHAAKIITSWFRQFEQLNIAFIIMPHAWVVGSTTEIILKNSNFIVRYVAKNVQDLMQNIPRALYNQTIYLSSNVITETLAKEIRRQVIYEVKYATQLQQIETLKKGIDYILLYSQNCTKILIQLLIKNDLLKLLVNTIVITISFKISNIIRPFVKKVIYCNDGKAKQMIKLLIHDAKIKH